jgi:phosphatidylserine/phosphatidylglycerophosphate/cardiolipin synthase-like enzyme
MTIPGVGAVVALTYRATVDQPQRFVHSRAVGAHVGLTPKRYQSGEIDYDGGVSKCGDALTQAMWGYVAARKTPSGEKIPASSPHIFQSGGVSVIRATALTDKEIHRELGDFLIDEKLTAPGGKAIIHDKILVIDPLDSDNCVVAFGGHNFGYKASYSNDENLVIVRGHQALAEAYAAHVLDVYDHYRFRAVEAELSAKKNSSLVTGTAADPRWDGFLDTTDRWQSRSSRRLSDYFTG